MFILYPRLLLGFVGCAMLERNEPVDYFSNYVNKYKIVQPEAVVKVGKAQMAFVTVATKDFFVTKFNLFMVFL